MALSRLNVFLKQKPLLVSLVSNTVKTAAADLVTQHLIEGKKETDWKRLSVFTTFGFAYLGGWQYYLFNHIFVKTEKLMRIAKWSSPYQAATLTFLDMAVHTPLMYYPAFYSLKHLLDGKTLNDAVVTYKKNISNDVVAMCRVWVPVQMVNFMFVPLHLRMPFITSVSFLWTIILSMMHGKA